MIVFAHDYETTGVNPAECGVVQFAAVVAVINEDGTWEEEAFDSSILNPGEPIPDGASNIHGIYDNDVEHCPPYYEELESLYEDAFSNYEIEAVVGYNSNSFDNVIAGRCGLPQGPKEIDLMTAANRLLSRGIIGRARLVDAYGALTGLEPENAHDAMADVRMTLDIIKPAMEQLGFTEFSKFAHWLTVPEVNVDMPFPFGKHRGMPVSAVPRGYLRWALRSVSPGPDLKASIEEALSA